MSKVLIVLDAGHGGQDPGATGNGLKEKVLTLQLAKLTKTYLENRYEDVKVLLTRSTDKNLSLDSRTNFANKMGADYLCSLHINAGGGQGFESFIYNGSFNGKLQTNVYRSIIHDHVLRETDFKDRGEKEANFHMVRESKMPASLLEFGFIDNRHDAGLLKRFSFLQRCASGTADGIADAMGLQPKKKKPTINGVYVVQAGVYNKKENAEELARKIEKEVGVAPWVYFKKQ